MTIEKENKTALKEAFDAELLKQLEENPPEIPSYEKFSSMIDGEVKKRRRRIHIISTAASIALLFLAGIATFSYFAPDIQADKNPKEEIITEDSVIIEDGGYGSSDEKDNVWVIEEWEHVYDVRKVYENFLIPEYIPEGYTFDYLKIESFEVGNYICEYLFANKKGSVLEIEVVTMLYGETTTKIEDFNRVLESKYGEIYIQENENKKAIMQIDDGYSVYINANMPDEAYIKVIEAFSY